MQTVTIFFFSSNSFAIYLLTHCTGKDLQKKWWLGGDSDILISFVSKGSFWNLIFKQKIS